VLTGFVRNAPQLYAARFLLGVAEAGYFPGILLYLTYWFRRREQARMIALFMAAIPVSNILGSPLSGWILDHVHWLGVASWRWLLILEGLPAIVGGLTTYLLLPSRPAEAAFLTAQEKDWIAAALAEEKRQKPRAIRAFSPLSISPRLKRTAISTASRRVRCRTWLVALPLGTLPKLADP